jgi:hypothetical protein
MYETLIATLVSSAFVILLHFAVRWWRAGHDQRREAHEREVAEWTARENAEFKAGSDPPS